MDDVWGNYLGPPHGTTPAAVIANKNIKVNSFESNETLRQSVDHFAQFWIKLIFSLFQFASLGSLVSFIVTCAKHPVMTNLSLDGCTVKSQDVSSGR